MPIPHAAKQRRPWLLGLVLSPVLGLSAVLPAWSQDGTEYRWRRVSQDVATSTPESSQSGRNRWEKTYQSSDRQLSGRFRFWVGENTVKDVDWQARYAPPPEVISASQPLTMRLDGSLTSRSGPFAEVWSISSRVEDATSSRERILAAAGFQLDGRQRARNATLEFTPNERTPARLRILVYMGSQGPARSKSWVRWEYQREGSVGGGPTGGPGGNGGAEGTAGGSGDGSSGSGGGGSTTSPGGSTDPGGTSGGPGTGGSGSAGAGGNGGGSSAGGDSASGGGRTIRADRYLVDSGELIWVPIRLLRPAGVANMNYTVRYDARVARVDGELTAGNLLAGRGIFSANPRTSGVIRLGFAADVGYQRDGSVAVVPFRAVGRPGTRTALDIEVSMVQDAAGTTLPIARIDGLIEIRDPTGGVDPEDPGRYDCDGRAGLTVADAQCALDMSVGLRAENLRVDIDSDGRVTSADAREILQLAIQGRR